MLLFVSAQLQLFEGISRFKDCVYRVAFYF